MEEVFTNMSSVGNLEIALLGIDKKFRDRIIKSYIDLRAGFSTGLYDAAGLRAGVFAEAAARFLQQELTGSHTPFGSPLPNFADLCRSFERVDKTKGSESLRVILPRALFFIYTLRNKRGIGHIGGDVEANQIDAATCLRTADWCICELVRIYHNLPIEDAQALLDAISVRQIPSIWAIGGKKRVLNTTLSYPDQVLLLLHSTEESGVLLEDLADWIEHPRISDFRSKVLSPLHNKRMIEWDRETDAVQISPIGVKKVEDMLLRNPLTSR
jgi:hypothetical protein